MRTIIVEDSYLAREELKELLKTHFEISVIGEAENSDEAAVLIEAEKPDLIFLDIQMPGKTGFELLEMLNHVPLVVFTTAYDEYAVKSFEYNALDYLIKPIREERLASTIKKLMVTVKQQPVIQEKLSNSSRIFVKDSEQCWLLNLEDIRMFESCGNYTRVHFGENKPMIYKSLSKIEDRLDPRKFFRVNRQYIVSLNEIKNVKPWFNGRFEITLHDNTELKVSRRSSAKLKQNLSI